MVIHGAIDGYSRSIIYMRIHTNNLAATMVDDFVKGINDFGIPSRVRADHGGEFSHVQKMMEEINNNEDHNSFIKGKSVHNQRIERLWRDVFTKVANKYYNIFNIMENNNILDIENATHLAVLHYVFPGRIQCDLTAWRNAHNIHPVRTERNKSPLQLWHKAVQMSSSGRRYTAISNLFDRNLADYAPVLQSYSNSNNLDEPLNIEHVLPRFPLPLTEQQVEHLKNSLPYNKNSEHDGVDIYGSVLQYVMNCNIHTNFDED